MTANYFERLLGDRGNRFEIETELQLRKIFENKTSHNFEFRKNDDAYGWDIECFRYDQVGSDWIRKFCCFVEVEVSQQWVNDYPSYWKTYSFLARKIHPFVNSRFCFNQLKENGEKCFYLIANKTMTDCKTLYLPDAINGNIEQVDHQRIGNYRNQFRRFDLGSPFITIGLENSINQIIEFAEAQ